MDLIVVSMDIRLDTSWRKTSGLECAAHDHDDTDGCYLLLVDLKLLLESGVLMFQVYDGSGPYVGIGSGQFRLDWSLNNDREKSDKSGNHMHWKLPNQSQTNHEQDFRRDRWEFVADVIGIFRYEMVVSKI